MSNYKISKPTTGTTQKKKKKHTRMRKPTFQSVAGLLEECGNLSVHPCRLSQYESHSQIAVKSHEQIPWNPHQNARLAPRRCVLGLTSERYFYGFFYGGSLGFQWDSHGIWMGFLLGLWDFKGILVALNGMICRWYIDLLIGIFIGIMKVRFHEEHLAASTSEPLICKRFNRFIYIYI